MTQELEQMYREIVLEHSKDPRNIGPMKDARWTAEGFNPLCGDKVKIQLKTDGAQVRIERCMFEGEGCSICMASASILTEEVQNKTAQEALDLVQNFRNFMQGAHCPLGIQGDLASLSGVRSFPVRIKCALLPWTTLKEAVDKWLQEVR